MDLAFLWSNWHRVVRLPVFYEKLSPGRGEVRSGSFPVRTQPGSAPSKLPSSACCEQRQAVLAQSEDDQTTDQVPARSQPGVTIPQVLELLTSSLKQSFYKEIIIVLRKRWFDFIIM